MTVFETTIKQLQLDDGNAYALERSLVLLALRLGAEFEKAAGYIPHPGGLDGEEASAIDELLFRIAHLMGDESPAFRHILALVSDRGFRPSPVVVTSRKGSILDGCSERDEVLRIRQEQRDAELLVEQLDAHEALKQKQAADELAAATLAYEADEQRIREGRIEIARQKLKQQQ